MRNIKRIYASIYRCSPWAAMFTSLNFLYMGLMPALVTIISISLFDHAVNILKGGDDLASLYLFAALYLLLHLMNDLFLIGQSIITNNWIYEKCNMYFRLELGKKFATLPLITLEDVEILNRKERADKVVNNEALPSIFQRTQGFLQNAISIVAVALVLTRHSIWLLPLSLLSVMPYLFARIIRGNEFVSLKQAQAKKTRILRYLWGLFTTQQSAKEMRVMGFDGYITDKWQKTRDEVNEEIWELERKDAASMLLCDGVRIAGYCFSIFIVIWLVVNGSVPLAVFGGALTAFQSLQNNMRDFLIDIGQIIEDLAYANDYYSFLDMPSEVRGTEMYTGLKEKIKFDNVYFKYPNSNDYALKSINITIKKGEKIAIVGENGSGKTTFSKILLGLYPPEKGQVLYDGKAVNVFTEKSFYSRVSVIAQDFVSYNLTLRENVAISNIPLLKNDFAIKSALRAAGFGTNINLNDIMGREFGGNELSVGQWQKIAIARGIFKDSELIVLDEPTSALDPIIETEILTRFIEVAEGKTAIIISHRVGLCKLVDRIIVMKDGIVVEEGPHEVLLDLGGVYAGFYREQAKWYRV